jgi:DNA-binding response OmpR family regulator
VIKSGTGIPAQPMAWLELAKMHAESGRGQAVTFTSIEFNILKMLMIHAGEVLMRDDLLDDAWGKDVVVTQRSVDSHIVNLRRKLGDDSKNPGLIISIRSMGYKLIAP